MKCHIFRVEVEVSHMDGTQLPDDCAGAFVSVYLAADDIKQAVEEVEKQLVVDCYRPVLTLAAYLLDLNEYDYDTDEEGYPGNDDLRNLRTNGGCWYGPFNLFPPESTQVQ